MLVGVSKGRRCAKALYKVVEPSFNVFKSISKVKLRVFVTKIRAGRVGSATRASVKKCPFCVVLK